MSSTVSSPDLAKGRIWYSLGGTLCALVGAAAIARPGIASVAIADIIGIFCVVSGAALLASALFGRAKQHRLLDFFSAALRVIVGVLLIVKVVQGVMALTLVLVAIFVAEGIFGILFGLKMRGKNPAWIWMVLNGLVALVLAGLLLAKFPSDAPWAIGMLFGINCLFLGFSLVAFAISMPTASEV